MNRINNISVFIRKLKTNDNSGTFLLSSTCYKIPERVGQRMIDVVWFFPPISRFKSAFRCGCGAEYCFLSKVGYM